MDGYRSLLGWQMADRVAVEVYRVTMGFPPEERFGLTSQLRRAAVSIPTNIAEGVGRRGSRELSRFIGIALGSTAEVDYLVDLSHRLGFIESDDCHRLRGDLARTGRLLAGLLRSLG